MQIINANTLYIHLPLDFSCQVGDQFLISGSPQTTFGRIGEWATSNLQPCTDFHHREQT